MRIKIICMQYLSKQSVRLTIDIDFNSIKGVYNKIYNNYNYYNINYYNFFLSLSLSLSFSSIFKKYIWIIVWIVLYRYEIVLLLLSIAVLLLVFKW